MARALHLLHGDRPSLVSDVVTRQVAAGDEVTVVLLHGALPPALPAGVAVRRAPADMSWRQLVDLIFAADHVTAW